MLDRRRFLCTSGASLGAAAISPWPGPATSHRPDRIVRRTLRRIGGSWVRIAPAHELPGDRVAFENRTAMPPRVFARFLVEAAPEGHAAATILTPLPV